MDRPVAISVQNVFKSFKLPHERYTGIKQALINFRFGKRYEVQNVLHDITFDIHKGEFFGIVGRNGSGKSTLLKVLAQIYTTQKGGVQINGTLTPFIELGVGFNPELTGKENVYLNGALLGFDKKQVDAMYDDIVSFAELYEFMDQKLKNYSSGMQVRLAFSVAIRSKSDILLVDEVLAVGDAAFQKKCFDYFIELKKRGTTVVFVSHDRGALERFCDRGVLINDGVILEHGPIKKVLDRYSKIVLNEIAQQDSKEPVRETITTPYLEIKDVVTLDSKGKQRKQFAYGENLTLQYTARISKKIVNPVFGLTVWEKNLDRALLATNTLIDGVKETGVFEAGEAVTFAVVLPHGLNDGEYYIEPAIANESITVFYQQIPKAATFFISGSINPHSILSFLEPIHMSIARSGKETTT